MTNCLILYARKVGEVGMIREYIVKISDEIMEEEIADKPHELVRCKDCKHGYKTPENGFIFCMKPHQEPGSASHSQDWFCADGERKDT